MKQKQILSKKENIDFYQRLYEKIGYQTESVRKIDRHFVLTIVREMEEDENAIKKRRHMEEKLRWIELTSRKKSGFASLHRNLMIHILLFCIQASIFYCMNLRDAHPREMLQASFLFILFIFVGGMVLKLVEIFRWNKTIRQLKEDLLSENEEIEEIEQEKGPIVSVLFTRGHGFVSEMIYWLTGRQYTHASIGIDEKLETFYSFDARGFRIEHPAHRKTNKACKESLCYQFRVSKAEYACIQETLLEHAEKKSSYRYNLIGAVFGAMHIYMPIKTKRTYFCSEFVTEQLKKIHDIQLKRSPKMYLPSNLSKALVRQKNIDRILVNEV